MDSDLRQLRAFLAVAENASFTGAADSLHLTQQSVSALVRRLENSLGTTLFERSTRKVTLTQAGQSLFEAVEPTLAQLDRVMGDAQSRGRITSPLRLASSPAMAFGPLQDLLAALKSSRSLPIPEVQQLWGDELVQSVRDGRFDAALTVEVDEPGGLEVQPWRRHRVDLLVSRHHPLAQLTMVKVSQLENIDFCIPDRAGQATLQPLLAQSFARAMVDLSFSTAPRISAIPGPVMDGGAVTIWLNGLDDRYVPSGFVHLPVGEPETYVTTYLVTALTNTGSEKRRLHQQLKHAIAKTSSV